MLLTKNNNNKNGLGIFNDPFDSILNGLFNDFMHQETAIVPKADVSENDKEYNITIALPGIKKEDLNIELEDKQLVISGERKFENKENHKYHRIETYYGNFKRSFYLSDNVKEANIQAKSENGILQITVPKDIEKKALKKIEVL